MKYLRELMTEHGEASIKRVLILLGTVSAGMVLYQMLTCEEPTEGHRWVFGELLGFITFMVFGAIANKHTAFNKSTNQVDMDEDADHDDMRA